MWVQTVEEGCLGDGVKEYMCEKVLPEGEGWIKHRGNVWTGRGGELSAVTTPLRMFLEGVRCQSYR